MGASNCVPNPRNIPLDLRILSASHPNNTRGVDLEVGWRRPVAVLGGAESIAFRTFLNRTLESSATNAGGSFIDRVGQTGLVGGARPVRDRRAADGQGLARPVHQPEQRAMADPEGAVEVLFAVQRRLSEAGIDPYAANA